MNTKTTLRTKKAGFKRLLSLLLVCSLLFSSNAPLVQSVFGSQLPAAVEEVSNTAPEAPAVTPEAPAVTPEAPAATPEVPAATPEAPAVTPEAPTATPEAPAATPEAPAVTPEAPTATPEAPAATPEAPAATPEAPAVTPDPSTLITRGLRIASIPTPLASYTGNSYKLTLNKGDAGLTAGFDSLKIVVTNIKGGYGKDTPASDRAVRFGFEGFLDNDYLYHGFEQLVNDASFPLPAPQETDEDYNRRLKDWLNNLPDDTLAPLTFDFDLGANFTEFNMPLTDIKDASGESFGFYTVTNGKVHVNFHEEIYAYQDIFAAFSFDATLNKDVLLEDDKKEIGIKDGKIIDQSVGTSGGGSGDPDAPSYAIDKDGPALVKTSSITYTMSIGSTAKNPLNGKTFVDYLPAGLEVRKVSLGGTTLQPNEYTISADGKELLYDFPALVAGEEPLIDAAFTVELGLSTAQYQELIDKKGLNKSFTNKAALLDGQGGKPLAESEDITTKMALSFLKKSGTQESLQGSRYRWTVDATTHLPYLQYGYLVDSLCATYHQYDFTTGITIAGTTYSTGNGNITQLGDQAGYDWENLTAEKLNALAQSVPAGNAFYFEYDGPEPDPFDPTKDVKLGILVLPFTDYAGKDKDKTVQLKYFTDLNLHGLTMDAYMHSDAHKAVNVENVVNLLWKNHPGSNGPDSGKQPEQVTFGKVADTVVDIMEKNGVSYNPKTQEISWKLTVNKMGANLNDVVVTDILPKGTYAKDMKINYMLYDGRTALPTTGLKPLEPSKYTLTPATKDTDGLLTIKLGTVSKDQFYVITLTTKLTDTNLLAKNAEGKIENKATIEANIDDTPKKSTLDATLKIPNSLIKKSNLNTYDYNTHQLFWEITVNPNSLHIVDAAVTDTLPTGTTFQANQLSAVLVNGKPDDALLATVKAALGTTVYTDQNPPKLSLGVIQTPVTLRFATTIAEAFRETDFTKAKTFTNKGELTGNVVNEHGNETPISEAVASSAQAIKGYNLTKNGVYNKADGSIAWDVLVNIFGKNLANTTFVEDLWANGRIHELRIGTIQAYPVTLNANGTVKSQGSALDLTTYANYTERSEGFQFTFPPADDRKAYRIQFTTDLRDEAALTTAKISNTVHLEDLAGEIGDVSNDSNGGFNGGFDLDDAAGRNPRPKLTLEKVSSNSINTSADASLPLSEAFFSLTAYEIAADGTVDWSKDLHIYEKMRITNGGKAIFMNIMPADNVLYLLNETFAPAGYKMQENPQAFVFVKDNKPFADQTEIDVTLQNVFTGKLNVQVIEKDANASYKTPTIRVTNVPVGTGFSFIKKQPNTYTFAIDTETVTHTPLADAKFTLTPTGELAGKVQPQTAVSNATGKVTFAKPLDPGTYKVTETESATNLTVGGTFTLTVAYNAAAKAYTYTLGNFTNGLADGGTETDLPVVNNDYLRGDVALIKQVQYQDKHTDGTTPTVNQEVLPGAAFTLTGTVAGVQSNTYTATVTSRKDGTVTFTNVPVGIYTLTETTTPNGMIQSSPTYKVAVKEKATSTAANKAVEVVVTLTNGVPLVENRLLPNHPIKGTITFDKQSWWGANGLTHWNNKPLSGVEFGLYRKIGNNTSTRPIYTATSTATGQVKFTNVEYGAYVLKERTTPTGYQKLSDFTIDKGQLILNAPTAATSFTATLTLPHPQGTTGTVAYNQLRKQSTIDFVKKRDDAFLKDVGFTLFRRGTAVATDGSGLVLAEPDTQTDYNRYLPVSPNNTLDSIKSDNSGKFSVKNLPVGDYILLETKVAAGAQLQDDKNMVAVRFTIKDNGTTATTIANMDITQLLQATALTSTTNLSSLLAFTPAATTAWNTLAAANNTYTISNYEKYGFVQLNKLYAEKDENGNLIPTATSAPNAVFQIKDVNDASFSLTLKTNDAGQFTPDANGYYTDSTNSKRKVHLHFGDYTIQETTAPTHGEILLKTSIPFTIGEAATQGGHLGTAWIAANGTAATVAYTKAGATPPTDPFVNGVNRETLTLKKVSSKSSATPLGGAGFTVYNGNTAVASLTESTTTVGTYLLSNTNPTGGIYTLSHSTSKLPYLFERGNTWYLLQGTYTIKETTAPTGYEPAADLTVTLAAGTLTLTPPNSAATISDTTLTLKEEPIELDLLKIDQATTTPVANVDFYLQGVDATYLHFTQDNNTYTYSNKGDKVAAAKLTTNGQGKIALTQLPAGTYTLHETTTVPGYPAGDTILGTITVAGNGAVTTTAAGIQISGSTTPLLTITNQSNSLVITKKFFAAGAALTGNTDPVTFQLNAHAPGVSIPAKAIDAKQQVTFTQIPDGVYDLIETMGTGYMPYPTTILTVTVEKGLITLAGSATAKAEQYADLSTPNQPNATATIHNYKMASFSFVKNGDGKPLSGATFQLTGTGYNQSVTTTATGVVTFADLVPGIYTLQEISTQNGYAIQDAVVTVTVDAKGVVTLAKADGTTIADIAALQTLFTNQKIALSVAKLDETGAAVNGVSLTLTGTLANGDTSLTWVTDGTAKDLTAMLVGGQTYTLTETARVRGYKTATALSFTVQKNGSITKVSGFGTLPTENLLTGTAITLRDITIAGSIQLNKTLPAGYTGGYTGIHFDLYKSKEPVNLNDPAYLPTANPAVDTQHQTGLTLDDTGTLTVSALPEGYYYFVENATQSTLYLDNTPSKVLYIGEAAHGTVIPVAMENQLFATNITLKKVDATDGTAIANTGFTLQRQEGTDWVTVIENALTNNKGELTVPITQAGAYQLVETTAVAGYVLNQAALPTLGFTVTNTAEFQGKTLDLRTGAPDATATALYALTLQNLRFHQNGGISNERQLGTLTLQKSNESGLDLNGVTFTLYQKNTSGGFDAWWDFITGNTYKPVSETTWGAETTGADGSLRLENLPWGDYRIQETQWLDGYKPAKDVYHDFTIGKTSTDMVLTVDLKTITNTRTKVFVAKVNPQGVNLAGAQLTLSGKFANGTTTQTWTSTTTPQEFTGLLLAGQSYVLTETKAPLGYKLLENSTTLVMDADGNLAASTNNTLALVNEPIVLLVQKFSPQGDKLSGCVFRVTGEFVPLPTRARTAQGTQSIVVDDANPNALQGRLIPGNEYLLEELVAPLGYVVGGAVPFTVDENGTMTLLGNSTEYEKDANGNIQMTNDPTTLKFAKVDENGAFIDGAVFTVEGLFADGSTKKTFSPTAAGTLAVHEQFVENQQYTLTETTAPQGYVQLTTPIVFQFHPRNLVTIETTVDGLTLHSEQVSETIKKTIFTITLRNKKTPVVPTPTPTPVTPTPPATNGPTTGDTQTAGIWIGMGLFALGGICLLKRKRT